MMHKLIPWQDKVYHAVEITLFPETEKEERVTVSTEELQSELLNKEGTECISKEAEAIDDGIVYYVTPNEMKLPEEEIRKIVEDAISE
ncbi:hypothetical protein [Bacteroides sp. 224]|uniref:hypothetical protein n=1 Tax=Bacteroides sp. 224 TaxID=2302936 RepID=UPI0013D7E1DB|nr:hypothetical protein [Bacteroides sp. 224]NDV64003.1 hypothetical protein [Bacteroides sp. 224]